MLDAVQRLRERQGRLKVIVSLAPSVQKEMVMRMIREHAPQDGIELSAHPVREVFARSRLVVAVSGTVTLEAAISVTPMVIIYKVSPLSYRFAKALVRVSHVGLANLISGREIVPELLQDDATPEKIARTVQDMLGGESRLENIRRQMRASASVIPTTDNVEDSTVEKQTPTTCRNDHGESIQAAGGHDVQPGDCRLHICDTFSSEACTG